MRDTPVPGEGADGRETRHRRRLRALAREPDAGAQQLRGELALQAAGGLLGHVPGEDHGRSPPRKRRRQPRSTGTRRSCRSSPSATRSKMTDVLKKKGDARGVRRRWQADPVRIQIDKTPVGSELQVGSDRRDTDHGLRTTVRCLSQQSLPSPRRTYRLLRASCRRSA